MRRAIAILLLAACPAPSTRSQQPIEPRPDGTCPQVAWSCVGMLPGTTEAWGCTEGDAAQLAHYQATCTEAKGGRFALDPCPRDLVVGGCTLSRGAACATIWYHAPATRADVERACARDAAIFVLP